MPNLSNPTFQHLARGVVGFGALIAAVLLSAHHPWTALVLVPLALIALRGCPACWLMGLAATLTNGLAQRGDRQRR